MGVCSSKTTELINKEGVIGIDGPIGVKGKDGVSPEDRPMSSTLKHDTAGSRSATPQGSLLITGDRERKASLKTDDIPPKLNKHMMPNAANLSNNPSPVSATSPQQPAFPEPVEPAEKPVCIEPVRHETDKDRTSVKLYIPWEAPVLGSEKKVAKRPRFSSEGRKKRSSKKGSNSGLDRRVSKKEQVFIPGTGKEKILRAGSKMEKSHRESNRIALAPLEEKIKKAKPDAKTRASINEAREELKLRKKQARAVNKILAEHGFDSEVAKIVRQYAGFGRCEDTVHVAEKRRRKS